MIMGTVGTSFFQKKEKLVGREKLQEVNNGRDESNLSRQEEEGR
jgi:hypothetical protein